jgi:hypothetical protein
MEATPLLLNRGVQAVLAAVCLLWLGMLLGISFLATPVKFAAPSLTLTTGLDVGRRVFGVFNKIELFWAFAGLVLLWMGQLERKICYAVALAGGALMLQTWWLLPVLDRQVGMFLAGAMPPVAPYHVYYVALDVVKLAALSVSAVQLLSSLACVDKEVIGR